MISFNIDSIAILVLFYYIFGIRTQKKPGPFDSRCFFRIILAHNKYGDSDDHQHKDENKREGKEAGEMGWIPESGRSPGGNPLQYSCLENLMDRGTWLATIYGVTRVGHDLATKPPT